MISPLFQIFLFCTQRENTKTKIQSQKFLFPAVFFEKSCWCFFAPFVFWEILHGLKREGFCVSKNGGERGGGWISAVASSWSPNEEERRTRPLAVSDLLWPFTRSADGPRRSQRANTNCTALLLAHTYTHTHTHRADTLHSTTTTRWGPYIERKKAYRKRHTHTRSENDMQSGDYRPLDFQRLIVLIIVFSSWYGASLK